MESVKRQDGMNLGVALLYYIASLAAIVGCWWLIVGFVSLGVIDAKASWPIIPLLILYFGIGVFLSKVVLKKLVEWHPVYDTASNVAGAKIKLIILWPISYPVLFTNLFVSEKL